MQLFKKINQPFFLSAISSYTIKLILTGHFLFKLTAFY